MDVTTANDLIYLSVDEDTALNVIGHVGVRVFVYRGSWLIGVDDAALLGGVLVKLLVDLQLFLLYRVAG